MSLAQGTLVEQTASKMVAIEDFTKGGPVMAATRQFKWSEFAVAVAESFKPASPGEACYVTYGSNRLVVTPDHLFMVKTGGKADLSSANQLAPSDLLVTPDGGTVAVSDVAIGIYSGDFHAIATSSDPVPNTDWDGHLLNTNGVISADYALQCAPSRDADAERRRPSFGNRFVTCLRQLAASCRRSGA